MPGTTKIADLKTGDEAIIVYSNTRWKLGRVTRTPKRIKVFPYTFDLSGNTLGTSSGEAHLKLATAANMRKLRELEAAAEKKRAERAHAEEVREAEKRLKVERIVMDIRKAKDHNDAVKILTKKLWELQNL